jgi:hypothetical protein
VLDVPRRRPACDGLLVSLAARIALDIHVSDVRLGGTSWTSATTRKEPAVSSRLLVFVAAGVIRDPEVAGQGIRKRTDAST